MSARWSTALLAAAAALIASGVQAKVDPRYDLEPTPREFAMYYPVQAMDRGRGGGAVLDCVVQADATLGGCAVVSETPAGLGFGAAGLRMARMYRMKAGSQRAGDHVSLPLEFRPPGR